MKNQVNPNQTNAVIVKVSDNSEYDESAELALIIFTPELKAIILKARAELMRLKKELDSATYDVRIFNYNPKFLAFGEVENLDAKVSNKANEGAAFVSPEFAKQLEDAERVRTDVELLHINEHSFFWSGYYKHTDVRYTTEGIDYERLLQLK